MTPIFASKVLLDKSIREIQEQEDAEFIKHVELVSGLKQLDDEAFQFYSRCQFMPPLERIISVAEWQLSRRHIENFSAEAKKELAQAMASPFRDRLRETSFARKILPPRQV